MGRPSETDDGEPPAMPVSDAPELPPVPGLDSPPVGDGPPAAAPGP